MLHRPDTLYRRIGGVQDNDDSTDQAHREGQLNITFAIARQYTHTIARLNPQGHEPPGYLTTAFV
jgi:hypothetical protein